MSESAPSSSPASTEESTTLTPSYNLPIALVLLSILLLPVQPWLSAVVALFGVFLLYQSVSLRLTFTATALDIFRGDTLIRRFPYTDWQNWQIFWQPLPILLYFKEVKSIHFVPVLFNPRELKNALEARQLPQI